MALHFLLFTSLLVVAALEFCLADTTARTSIHTSFAAGLNDDHAREIARFTKLQQLLEIDFQSGQRFSPCHKSVKTRLAGGGQDTTCAFFYISTSNSTSQELRWGISVTEEIRENLTKSGIDGFPQNEANDFLRELNRSDVTLMWNAWRNRCDCSSGSVKKNDRGETRRQFVVRSSVRSAGPDLVSQWDCLTLTATIVTHLSRSWDIFKEACDNSMNTVVERTRLASVCSTTLQIAASLEKVLGKVKTEEQVSAIYRHLQEDIAVAKYLSERIQLTWRLNNFHFEDFADQAANLLCFVPHSENIVLGQNQSAIHSSNQKDQLRLCPEHCNDLSQILGAIDKISVSSHMPGSLTFLRHTANTHCARYSKSATQCAVIDNGEVYVQNRSNNSTNLTGKFCTNFICHNPLRTTKHIDRSWEPFRTFAKKLDGIVTSAVGGNSSWTNGSLFLLCGLRCGEIGSDEHLERIAHIVFAVSGFIAAGTSGFAVVTYLLNRHRIRALARRIIVYLNFGYFLFALDDVALVSRVWVNAWASPCHSDGILRDNQSSRFDVCTFNAARNVFIVYFLLFISVFGTHAWYRLLVSLSTLSKQETGKSEKRLEYFYLFGTIGLSLTLTIVTMTQARIVGTPLSGGCFAHRDDWFYYYGTFFSLCVGIGLTYIAMGLPLLLKLYRSSANAPRHTCKKRSPESTVKGASPETPVRSGLTRLAKLLSFYVFFTMTHATVYLGAFCYSFFRRSINNTETKLLIHLSCLTFSCSPESCPPAPSRNVWLFMASHSYSLLHSCVFCTWAFRRTYWSFSGRAGFRKSSRSVDSRRMSTTSRIIDSKPVADSGTFSSSTPRRSQASIWNNYTNVHLYKPNEIKI